RSASTSCGVSLQCATAWRKPFASLRIWPFFETDNFTALAITVSSTGCEIAAPRRPAEFHCSVQRHGENRLQVFVYGPSSSQTISPHWQSRCRARVVRSQRLDVLRSFIAVCNGMEKTVCKSSYMALLRARQFHRIGNHGVEHGL